MSVKSMLHGRLSLRDERGQTLVLFGVILPLFFFLAAVTWNVGGWWTHRRHLQTKVDAAAFAGGGVWSFPCGSDSDTNLNGTGIIDQARKYVGVHITAAGTPYTSTTFNPQVGGTAGDRIHVVINGSDWWDDDSNPSQQDQNDPSGSVCNSMILDVKATEQDAESFINWIPFAPDIKRKARVQIEEIEGLRGLLPIAVRVPKPLSAAAVFYNENPGPGYGTILAAKYFREVCTPGPPAVPCLSGNVPAALGQWTTLDALGGNWAQFHVLQANGVVIATSFRPKCDASATPPITTNCLDISGFTTVDALCNQTYGSNAPVKCEYATGTPPAQTVQSGLQFIRGYDNSSNADNDPPVVRSVWLDGASAGCGAYFSAPGSASCSMALHANIDIGSVVQGTPPVETRTAANTEVRWKIAYGTGNNDDICGTWSAVSCDMSPSWSANVTVPAGNPRYSIALRVRLRNTTVPGFPGCGKSNFSANCEWYFTAKGRGGMGIVPKNATIFANPLQRTFMGNINTSGAVKWLRLTADPDCNPSNPTGIMIDGEAASQTIGPLHCFYMDMGLQGALAKDQDEPPIALNLGDTSQRSLLDCDPNISNLKDEVVKGCQDPPYATNKFNTTPLCPGSSQFFSTPKASPFAPPDYPPWRCVLTQPTSAGNQLISGFNERLFGDPNNPPCPTENTTWPVTTPPTPAPWTKGRNYWHNANNVIDEYTFADDRNTPSTTDDLKNRIKSNDPRLVTLFFTPYNSFTGNGNETYPVVGFGAFYITGYGRITGGGLVNDDPCTDGNSSGQVGAGNLPPADLDYSSNTTYVWGHYVKDVVPSAFTIGGTGVLCKPAASFQPCVAVLVE